MTIEYMKSYSERVFRIEHCTWPFVQTMMDILYSSKYTRMIIIHV